VFAISRDSPFSHRRYADTLFLHQPPLLSDWTGDAVRGFGVAQTLEGLVDSPVRSCFLIDGSGTVRASWRYRNDEVPDAEPLLAAARRLQGASGA
jgi:peroxiredoxin